VTFRRRLHYLVACAPVAFPSARFLKWGCFLGNLSAGVCFSCDGRHVPLVEVCLRRRRRRRAPLTGAPSVSGIFFHSSPSRSRCVDSDLALRWECGLGRTRFRSCAPASSRQRFTRNTIRRHQDRRTPCDRASVYIFRPACRAGNGGPPFISAVAPGPLFALFPRTTGLALRHGTSFSSTLFVL